MRIFVLAKEQNKLPRFKLAQIRLYNSGKEITKSTILTNYYEVTVISRRQSIRATCDNELLPTVGQT